MRRRNPGAFLKFTFIVFSQVQCVLGSQVSAEKKTTSKRRYVETAGSEQTSSVFMLWAKTRVYVCSGRAGGNERDLLFYVRYEEACPHPTPPHPTPSPMPNMCVVPNMSSRVLRTSMLCKKVNTSTVVKIRVTKKMEWTML